MTESPLSSNQTFMETEDGYQFAATVPESEQLKWWLCGFGFGRDLELVKPSGFLDN